MKIRKTKKIKLIVVEGNNKTELLYFKNFNHSELFNINIYKSTNTDLNGMVKDAKAQVKKMGLKLNKFNKENDREGNSPSSNLLGLMNSILNP